MISGSTGVSPNTSAINRRDAEGMRKVFFDGGSLPSEKLTDNGDDTYTLHPAGYWYNGVADNDTNPENQLSYQCNMHAATGTPNGRLIIYCHGHESDGPGNRDANLALITGELDDYDVLECFMLGMGDDTTQFNTPIQIGGTTNHTQVVQALKGEALQLFVWHLIAAVNTFAADYSRIFSMGFSGGGLMALWLAALDTRIAGAFPMAWGLPDWIIEDGLAPNVGDAEQYYGPLLGVASRVGWMAIAAQQGACHAYHNSNDTVLPLTASQATKLESVVQEVAPNFSETVVAGASDHDIESAWLTSISAKLATL